MKLRKEVTDLLEAGVINQETAERIEQYYQTKAGPSQNRLVIIFGILGAILVGLGIVLILTYNWDQLSRMAKTIVAFVPLVIGQAVCGYTLLKQSDSITWREGSSAFLVLAVGGCLSLVSYIYNISGSMESFLLVWTLLSFPVIYVMRSSVTSLLYLIGITWYACEAAYWGPESDENYFYWGLLLLAIPHYIMIWKKDSESSFVAFHHWFIPLSVIISLGTLAAESDELMFIAYMSLFGLLYQIGHLPALAEQKIRNNGYLVFGSAGSAVMLLILSFEGLWEEIRREESLPSSWLTSPESVAVLVLSLTALVLLINRLQKVKWSTLKPVDLVFILFIVIYVIGLYSPMAAVLVNLLLLVMGVLTIREGVRKDHFGIVNYGLLILTIQIICRFFDTDIHAVMKGLLFVLVGFGFFFTNYRMVKNRNKKNETQVQ
jgi:uncharacterized membrane protein